MSNRPNTTLNHIKRQKNVVRNSYGIIEKEWSCRTECVCVGVFE